MHYVKLSTYRKGTRDVVLFPTKQMTVKTNVALTVYFCALSIDTPFSPCGNLRCF